MCSGWVVSASAVMVAMVTAVPPRGFRITSRDGAPLTPLKGPCDPADVTRPWENNTRVLWVDKPHRSPYRPPYQPCPHGYQWTYGLEQPCVPSSEPSERRPSSPRMPVAAVRQMRPMRPARPVMVKPSGCPAGLDDPRCSLVSAGTVLRPVYCPPDCCPCPELMEANEAIPSYVTRPPARPSIHIAVTTVRPHPLVSTAVINIHGDMGQCPPGYFKITH